MIRVAVVSAGIGSEHVRACHALPTPFDLALVVDKDPSRIETIRGADSFTATVDLEEAPDDQGIELIEVCLSPHLHGSVSLKALAAGKHVICEKPLATSIVDVDGLTAATKRSGTSGTAQDAPGSEPWSFFA